jgi:hypothetical protein
LLISKLRQLYTCLIRHVVVGYEKRRGFARDTLEPVRPPVARMGSLLRRQYVLAETAEIFEGSN